MHEFEIIFVGSRLVRPFPRHRRFHPTYESAEATAHKILAKLECRGAHPAIIYGPGCGADGRTIA